MLTRDVVGKAKILLSMALLAGAVSACSLKVEDKARVSVTFPPSTSVNQSALSGSLFLSSLSGTPGRTGLVGLPTPTTLDDFTCFGINVTGGEIPPNPAFASCTNANMPYVGTVGGLAPIAGGTVMVDVNTQTDSGNYTFQLFALQSQGAIGCPAMSDAVISQFGSADMSNPVEVGRTSAVISGDTTLNIFASYNPGSPKPMFCPDGNGVPAQLALTGESNPNTIECEAYTVDVQDASGNPANVSFNLPLTLSGAGTGAFYTSSACATTTTTVTVNSGTSSATVYFKGGSAGGLTLQASGAGLTAGTLPVSVALPVLAYQSVPSAENATSVFTTQPVVEIQDFYGLPIATASNSVALQAFSGATCTGAPLGTFSGSTTVAASAGLATFIGLSWSTAETIYLKASAPGMTPVCSPAFVVSPPPGTVPVLTYGGSPYTFTMGSAITPAVPGNSGGAPTACTATPALPGGLSINPATCAISGTPSGLSGLTTYTINASNGSGAATPVNIDITVVAVPPSALAYSQATAMYTVGSAITNNTPTSSGGAVVSYSVAPALPTGLSINSSTGVISGTPVAISGSTAYTVTATNTGGSTNAVVNITVNDVPPSALAYSQPTAVYTVGSAITPNTPTSSGGAVVTYSISPALPTGLGINTSTGDISGTPTAPSSSTTYTVTALNSGGSGTATVSIVVNAVPATQLAFVTQPSASGTAGTALAQAPVVQVQDGGGSPVTTSTAKVRLMAYFDAACTQQAGVALAPPSNIGASANPVTAVSGNASFSGVVIRTPGTVYLGADSPGLTSACSGAISLSASGPTKLAIVGDKHYQINYCSREQQVRTLDTVNMRAAVGSSVTVNLSGGGSGAFYSDSTCSTPITQVTITSGNSSGSFWYKNAALESFTLSATSAGLTSATAPSNTLSNWTDPASFELDTPMGFLVNTCSPAFTVKRLSGNHTTPTLTSSTTVNLSASLPTTFYSDAGCTTPVTSVTIPVSSQTESFYVISTAAGFGNVFVQHAANLMVARPGLLGVAASSTPASLLFFDGGDDEEKYRALRAQSCGGSGAILLDANFDPAVSVSGGPFPLSTLDLIGFFTDNHQCDTPASSISMAAGSGAVGVNFSSSTSGSKTITVDGSTIGLSPASLGLVFETAVPEIFEVTGPASLTVNTCSSAYTVVSKTRSGTIVNADWPLFAQLSGGSGSSGFYSDASCASPISGVMFNIGDNTKTFYMRPTSSGNWSLYAEAPGVYTLGGLSYSVTGGGAPAHIGISGPQQGPINTCVGPLSIYSADSSWSNVPVTAAVTVNLTNTGSGGFYSTSGCTGPISSVTINSGQIYSSDFYFRDALAQSIYLNANDQNVGGGSLGSSSMSFVSAGNGTPNKLAVSGSTSVSTGMCMNFRVTVEDAGSLPVVAGSAVSAVLAGNGSGTFYSDPSCSSVLAASTVNILSGSATQEFWFKDATVESVSLSAAGSGLASANTLSVSVGSGGGNHLDWSGPNSPLASSYSPTGCIGPYHVEAKDGGNVPLLMTGSGKNLTLSGAAFYSDSACAATISSVNIPISQSSTNNFYILQTTSTGLTLSAYDNGGGSTSVSSGSYGVSVTGGGGGNHLTLNGPTNPSSGCIGPYTVESRDGGNAPLNMTGTSKTVSLSNGSGALFYPGAGCTGSIGSVSIPVSSYVSSQFYVYQGTSTTLNLSATDSGGGSVSLSPGALTVTVSGGGGGGATGFMMTLGSTEVAPGACAGPFQVIAKDNTFTTVNVGSTVTVNLSANYGQIYSSNLCATTMGSVAIASGTSTSNDFYFKEAAAHIVHITAHDQASILSDRVESLLVSNTGPATALQFEGATTFNTGNCQQYRIVSITAADTPAQVGSSKTVSFSDGAMGGTFYTDGMCTTPASGGVIIAGGTSSQWVFYKNSNPGNVSLNATASGLTVANLAVCIGSCGPTLALRFAPSLPAWTTASASSGAPVTIQLVNSSGTLTNAPSAITVNLNSWGNGGFYMNSNCTTPVSTTTINSGTSASAGSLYFCDPTARLDELQASASGYYTATTLIAMATSAGTTQWRLAGPPVQAVNTCQGYLLYLTNGAGMPSQMAGTFNTNLSLSNGSVGSNNVNSNPFYSDSSCTTPMAATAPVSLSSLNVGIWVYLKTGATAGATFVSTSNTGSPNYVAQLPLVTGGSGQPAMVGFDPSAILPTSGCVSVNIGVLDSTYQVIPGANNTSGTGTIQLDAVDPATGSQVSGVQFWDGGCAGTYLNAVPSVTPAAGISISTAGKVIGIDKAGYPGPIRVKAITSGGSPPPLATGTAVY